MYLLVVFFFREMCELCTNDFVLSNFLDGLEDILAIRAQKKNIHFYLKTVDELPRVHTDEKRLRQVLINLVDNAIGIVLI